MTKQINWCMILLIILSALLLSNLCLAQPWPAVPNVVLPQNMESNKEYRFIVSSYDQQGDKVSFFIEWGDGSQEGWSKFVSSNSTTNFYHSYPTPPKNHIFILKVRVKDDNGNESSIPCIKPFFINTPPNVPETPNGPYEGELHKSYGFTITSCDPDGDNICFDIDWGDGRIESTRIVRSGDIITKNHNWNSEGIFNIKVRARDEMSFNNISPWSSFHKIKIR
ncbi:MAG: hypothetical protein GF353_28865 [Candidatus Lokiarchaeota archaeon]|nr:hypothetical protein [Candidatus Lokiarchaeota archaeon]